MKHFHHKPAEKKTGNSDNKGS